MGNLCSHLDQKATLVTLEQVIPDFVTKHQSQYQAARSTDGDNRAFRGLLEKLGKCGSTSWPRAIEAAMEEKTSLKTAVYKTFWDIHKQARCKYSEKKL